MVTTDVFVGRSKLSRLRSAALLGVILGMMSGCIRTPRLEEMTPPATFDTAKLRSSVSVSFDQSIAMLPDDGMGNTVPREQYVRAVERALVESGVFAGVAPRGQADYDLDATVYKVTLGAPDGLGYVLVYEVTSVWKLRKRGDASALFDERVSGRGRANFGDAFNGITRNTLARERAARASIVEGVRRLSSTCQTLEQN